MIACRLVPLPLIKIAKRVTVLCEGRVLAEGNMDSVQNDPQVIEVYLGA